MNMRTKFEVRSFTHSQNLGSPWIHPRSLFPQIFAWAFVRMNPVKMYLPNLTFVALPVPEITGGTQKIGPSLDTPTATRSLFPKFLMGFCSDGPY